MRIPLFILIFSCAGFVSRADASDAAGVEFFEKNIRPLLSAYCYECHSSESKKIKGDLRLDHRQGWLKGGVSGPALVVGKPDVSLLVAAVRYEDASTQMPPKKKLPAAAIADLEKWVAMGAPGGGEIPEHAGSPTRLDLHEAKTFWSFQPLHQVTPPKLKKEDESLAAIDRFILARLEQHSLKFSPAADKRTLIRRASFDLTGLPPTAAEVEAFIKDDSPQAFATVIDRLLASSQYGERWGRHWLDVVRYADTAGETADYPLPHAWRYRNYVIDAFNRDKPYDQFLHEQIAGDLMAAKLPENAPPARYAELITATGYIAIARRFGFNIEQDHHLTLEDTVDTLGKSVLGLTIGCARCHDHKYDPISMQDFYALFGIFGSTRYPYPGCEKTPQPRDMMPLLSPQNMAQLIQPRQVALADAEKQFQLALSEVNKSSKLVHDLAVSDGKVIAKGELDNGGSQIFEAGQITADSLAKVPVKKGSAIQLAVRPRSHYGADSTLIELEISELTGDKRKWNLTADLLDDLHASGKGNAHRDSHDNDNVWCIIDQRKGGAFLDKYVAGANNTPGLNLWTGSSDGFPVVGVNTNAKEIKYVTVTQPARSVVLHPSNTDGGGVAILWVSPIDGEVSIIGKAIDIDGTGGDGVAWTLEALASPKLGDALLAMRDAPLSLAEPKRKRDALAAAVPKVDQAYAVTEGIIANAKFLKRGDPEKPGDPVPRRELELFGGEQIAESSGSGRLQLAYSLTRDSQSGGQSGGLSAQALTSRVMVNRIWLYHFGQGLVTTPNDFGSRGEKPSHPQLLEFLAHEFVQSGWSVKAMHRTIMLSKTYQQSSMQLTDTALASDPSNALLSHFARRRLDAEEIRDSMLAVSGDLDHTLGEAHPFPPEQSWGFTQHTPFAAQYEHTRRSVYLMVQRSRRHPFLSLFDGADVNSSTSQRRATTVPTQSLFFMNDPFVHGRAASIASRLIELPDDARLLQAYALLYQRAPSERERELSIQMVAQYRKELKAGTDIEKSKSAWAALIRVMLSSNEFVYVD